MPNTCKICAHDDRSEIENAILNLTSGAPPNAQNTVEQIADDFKVDVTELKAHAMFHTPLVGDDLAQYASSMPDEFDVHVNVLIDGEPLNVTSETEPKRESLTRKMKLREADLLSAVSNEYLVTLKAMGRKINKLAATSAIDIEEQENQIRLARTLTKPMVDLYIQTGAEIRQNVKTMAELDRLLNGPEDNNASGIAALAAAISKSVPGNKSSEGGGGTW